MKNKNNFLILISAICIIAIGIIIFACNTNIANTKIPYDINIFLNDDDLIEITYKGPSDVYVIESDNSNVDLNDEGFQKINDHSITFTLKDNLKYYYLKYRNNLYEVGTNEDLCAVDFKINNHNLHYLAIGEEYTYTYQLNVKGYTNKKVEWVNDNPEIISLNDGKAIAKKVGKAKLTAYFLNHYASRELIVSDLIIKAPKEFDDNKEMLPCGKYSEEENNLLDEILANRIEDATYQSRAAVVEAARFLTLNFPYKINYFYEWGRQDLDSIDGEGRYYLKGLYLDESRYDFLKGSNTKPQTWGCLLYSENIKAVDYNGLDCSGFVTWAIYNGGFDCGDIGSGFSKFTKSLTDIGELKRIDDKTIKDVKVGDLVHSDYTGGHIGIIIGKDENNFYISEATPKDDISALVVTKLKHEEIKKVWDEFIFMDTYYLNDGNLTNMW